MPDVMAGTLRTDLVASQKVPVHMDNYIHFEDESSYRFESLSRRFRDIEEVDNMRIDFMEHETYPIVMICSAAESATTITVDHPEYAHRDQLVYNTRTHEIYLMNEDVGGVAVSGKITVVNHTGSGSITTATAAGDRLLVLPEAHAEGEDIPLAFTSKPRFLYTYVQQSDKVLKYSDLSKGQKEYGEKQYLIDRKQAWIYWKRGINLMLYLGQAQRDATSASGPRRHTMRGLRDWTTTHRQNMALVPGGLTLTTLGVLIRECSEIGASSDSKIGLAGTNAMTSISDMPAAAIQTSVSETSWGKKITNVVTPFGPLAFSWDKTLSGTNGLDDVFAIIDKQSIHRVRFTGQPERLVMNVNNASDFHNNQDLITGTFGMKVVLEMLNAWVYGIG